MIHVKILSLPFVILLLSSVFVPMGIVFAAATFVDSLDVNGQTSLPHDLAFNTDGTKMFVVGDGTDRVTGYTCTAFDVSTCVTDDFKAIGTEETAPSGLAFNTDGTKMFVVGTTSDRVHEYTCTAFDVSTCNYSLIGESKLVSGEENGPQGLAFNNDGTKMFIIGNGGQEVNEYTCTAFDVSTCNDSKVKSVSTEDTLPRDLAFNTDGTKMFVLGDTGNDVTVYDCTTGFDVSTCSLSTEAGNPFDISEQDTGPLGLAFNDDGTKMYVSGFSDNGDIYEYTLEAAFDLFFTTPLQTSSSGDNSAPTMGTSTTGKRLIDDGFMYNNNPVDVTNFHTEYPLVRTPVGVQNTLDLKVLENQGINHIEFVSVHFGVPQIHAQGEAIITYYPFNDYTKIHDPNNLLGEIDISLDPVKCKANSEKERCVKFSLDHSFNEAPMHDIVRVTIADKTRNHADVFFNDGIEVYGDSLNPPNTASIAAQGNDRGLIHLTQTDRTQELWIDQEQNIWTKNIMGNFFQVTPNKYTSVNDDSVSSQGYDRIQPIFRAYMEDQELFAMQVWDGTLILSDIPDYIPDVARTETLKINDPILQDEIIYQIQLAEQLWDSQSIQRILDDYIPTLYTTQELGITDEDLMIEMQKANQLLEELYYLNKINENGIAIQKSPTLTYKSITNAKLSDEAMHDAKLSESDKAKQLLYKLYGLE